MATKRLTAAVLGLTALLASAGAWACSAAGPNTHVGTLMNVDAAAQSFTVLDAETNRPITFTADAALLARLADVTGQVVVDFEAGGGSLRATAVRH